MIVTVSTYRQTTGDTDGWDANVSARLEDAQERLEEALDRPLEAIERTEVLRLYQDGSLSPRAVPITAATGWTIDGDRLILQYPNALGKLSFWPQLGPSVTYTGGWVERTANPSAANRLPLCISDDLCWAAWRLLHPLNPVVLAAFIPGATSVQLGDASVSFGPGGPPAVDSRGMTAIRWSAKTLRYRYRENRSVGAGSLGVQSRW